METHERHIRVGAGALFRNFLRGMETRRRVLHLAVRRRLPKLP